MNISEWIKKARTLLERPARVLMYHQIAHRASDPWELSVSPEHFEQQLQVLMRSGLVTPVSQLAEQLAAKKALKPCIVLTFDDGYADNFFIAKPLLEAYRLPATFFISTKHVGKEKEYWWDELADILLHTLSLPPQLCLRIRDNTLWYDLQEECILSPEADRRHKFWKAHLAPPTQRSRLYRELWQLLSPLSYQEQQEVLAKLRTWAGVPAQGRSRYACMSREQLQELARQDLFTIGAHTVTHPALSCHPAEIQRLEISQSQQYLQTLTGSPVDTFAYPSGIYNPVTVNILRQQGFRLAFTTEEMPVQQQSDPYQISRYQVKNWPGKIFEQFIFRRL
jgi:peptidoglycan/xylan/chitin deacetylase (PgdA/CDA1 family)